LGKGSEKGKRQPKEGRKKERGSSYDGRIKRLKRAETDLKIMIFTN